MNTTNNIRNFILFSGNYQNKNFEGNNYFFEGENVLKNAVPINHYFNSC